jgi:deoxyribodipyrimidine photo-lyase
MAAKVNVFWFRRDLRLDDNVGFFKALHGKFPVVPLFIFDSEILNELPEDDARVSFIYDSLQTMRETLQENGSSLAMYHGKPIAIFEQLVKDFDIQNVITNHDYEVYAQERDHEVKSFLAEKDIGL